MTCDFDFSTFRVLQNEFQLETVQLKVSALSNKEVKTLQETAYYHYGRLKEQFNIKMTQQVLSFLSIPGASEPSEKSSSSTLVASDSMSDGISEPVPVKELSKSIQRQKKQDLVAQKPQLEDSKKSLATPPNSLPPDTSNITYVSSSQETNNSEGEVEELRVEDFPNNDENIGQVHEIESISEVTKENDLKHSGVNVDDEPEFVSESFQLPSENDKVRTKRKRRSTLTKQDEKKQKTGNDKINRKEIEKLERENKKIRREREKLEKKLQQEKEKEAKRKKLEQEKEARKRKTEEEKEAKKKKLEEEKEAKKRKLEEEKEAKKRKQEEEKLKKQQEKEAKEKERQEKLKAKEKSQLKISSFFSVTKKAQVVSDKKSDYDNTFLNFYVKPNCYLAPTGKLSEDKLESSKNLFDSFMVNFSELPKNTNELETTISWLTRDQDKHKRGYEPTMAAETIVQSINRETLNEAEIVEMLHKVPLKFLQFYENIKPAYCGTFSKKRIMSPTDPYYKNQGIDYEYDSDFEWNPEDEEGEEIDDLDDDDEDEDNDDGSDMDGFLDEENDAKFNGTNSNKRIIIGTLTPIIHVNKFETNSDEDDELFDNMQIDILNSQIQFPIDPFKNYWQKPETLLPKKETKSPEKELRKNENNNGSSNNSNTTSPSKTVQEKVANSLSARKKPKIVITEVDHLKKFVQLVNENNDFTLSTLVEILKKKFPSYTKVTVKNTLEHVASKKGSKLTDKKWIINDTFQEYLN